MQNSQKKKQGLSYDPVVAVKTVVSGKFIPGSTDYFRDEATKALPHTFPPHTYTCTHCGSGQLYLRGTASGLESLILLNFKLSLSEEGMVPVLEGWAFFSSKITFYM